MFQGSTLTVSMALCGCNDLYLNVNYFSSALSWSKRICDYIYNFFSNISIPRCNLVFSSRYDHTRLFLINIEFFSILFRFYDKGKLHLKAISIRIIRWKNINLYHLPARVMKSRQHWNVFRVLQLIHVEN